MQRIDVLGLQAFVAIAEEGSFRGAAERLNLTATAVTRRLQKLEDTLGVILISRTTRQLTLTKVGQDYLSEAQQLLSSLEQSLDGLRAKGRFSGDRVAFACLPTITAIHLPAILTAFTAKHATKLRIVDLSATEIMQQVRENKVEFGITSVGADYHDLTTEHLFSEPLVALVPRSNPLAGTKAVSWGALVNERLISIGHRSGIRRLIDTSMQAYDVPLTSMYEVQHLSSAVSLAAGGVGIAILPASAGLIVQSEQLVPVDLINPVVKRHIGIIWRNDLPMSPMSRRLCELITKILRPDAK